MINQKFGRLTVIKRAENDKNRNSRWLCQCTCGNFVTVLAMSLRSGSTKSCGCLKHDLKEGADYPAMHNWVRRNKPRPELCERCKGRPVQELSYNHTNKEGYTKDFNDYEWLCKSCHRFKDNGNRAIITKEEAYKIRKLYANKIFTQKKLAVLFKVNRKTINYVINGKGIYSRPISPETLKIFNARTEKE